jgi:hypothetical protein
MTPLRSMQGSFNSSPTIDPAELARSTILLMGEAATGSITIASLSTAAARDDLADVSSCQIKHWAENRVALKRVRH